MHGIVRIVFQDGTLYEGQKNLGVSHGYFRTINPDGSYLLGQEKQGQPYGKWYEYGTNGKLASKYQWREGKKVKS